jgi:hypothetical protein
MQVSDRGKYSSDPFGCAAIAERVAKAGLPWARALLIFTPVPSGWTDSTAQKRTSRERDSPYSRGAVALADSSHHLLVK